MLPAASPLAAWGTFYQIVGSSAGALTGLQFVVVALSAQSRTLRKAEGSLHAFGTPTVVHFGAVLLTAAIVSAPWSSLSTVGIALSLCGAGGLGYVAVVIRRTRQQRGYAPVLEDWLWHAVFPAIAYVTVGIFSFFGLAYLGSVLRNLKPRSDRQKSDDTHDAQPS